MAASSPLLCCDPTDLPGSDWHWVIQWVTRLAGMPGSGLTTTRTNNHHQPWEPACAASHGGCSLDSPVSTNTNFLSSLSSDSALFGSTPTSPVSRQAAAASLPPIMQPCRGLPFLKFLMAAVITSGPGCGTGCSPGDEVSKGVIVQRPVTDSRELNCSKCGVQR